MVMDNELIVNIEKMVFGGDGLAHLPDGRAVFVPFVLPGETVRIQMIEDKPRFARGNLLEIIVTSPKRIKPQCKHFGNCGGCHYQHIPYDEQLNIKMEVLRDQLMHIGKLGDLKVDDIIPSPDQWHYRNHLQFHVSGQGSLCFTGTNGRNLVAIEECHLPQPGINDTWPQIKLEPGSGIERLAIRQDSRDEIMLLFEGKEYSIPDFELDMPISATYLSPEGLTLNLAGEDAQLFLSGIHELRVSPESFFQVNNAQADAMVEYVRSLIGIVKEKRLFLELFSGVGLFSVILAKEADKLVAFESSPSACYDFVANLDCFDNIDLYEGLVEEILPGLELSPDLVLLDPPRAGLEKAARMALANLGCPQVIYVSCDPATLARDLAYLCNAGYEVRSMQPFDMFPQTYHVECICHLVRK